MFKSFEIALTIMVVAVFALAFAMGLASLLVFLFGEAVTGVIAFFLAVLIVLTVTVEVLREL